MDGRERLDPAERNVRVILWVLAAVLMLSAAAYQRRTGPTYPLRGDYEHAGRAYEYELIRTETMDVDARIELPAPSSGVTGTLVYRRYPSEDPPSAQAMRLEREAASGAWHLVARMPHQPAAGKMAYHVVLVSDGNEIRIPAAGEGEVVLRYKGQVPTLVLGPHVVLMFLALLIGLRAGFAAVLERSGVRGLSWTTLAGLTLGGMILGPLVQKHAFGEYWTGFPSGYDLTDNKTLIMWASWLVACVALALARSRRQEFFGRLAIVVATLITMGVYLVPHSLGGSELDYAQVDAGIPPAEAIEQGDR